MQDGQKVPGFRFDGSGGSFQTASVDGVKASGFRTINGNGRTPEHWTDPADREGVKGEVWFDTGPASLPSSSPRRKTASAIDCQNS